MGAPAELFKIPEFCPVCSSTLVEEGQFLYCRSRGCPVQLSGSVKVWIKRLGLLHWGDALVDSLTDPETGCVKSLVDLYHLGVDDIAAHCSGRKFAQKCWDTLHSNKRITVELVLASLNIPNLAVATATDIVQAGHNTVDKILALTREDLLKVQNVGEKTADQILYGLQTRRIALEDLSTVLEIVESSGPLSGKSFCITGATSKPRKAVEKQIMGAGGVVKTSVGAGLTFLVTNDKDTTSSKMKNAKKHGTTVISEEELYRLMGDVQA
jgi:DNA ligase (NAD+)